MPVLGLGGVFFRAREPETLSAWYRQHLDVGAGCVANKEDEPNQWCWMTEGGPVVFAPFAADTDYFADDKAYMVNFRVSDLTALIDDLTRAGVEVTTKAEWDHPDVGRFARIHDPEGNAVELWEPPQPTQ